MLTPFAPSLYGVATGDALGVLVEFSAAKDIWIPKGYERLWCHNLPPGTWSDDSSLTFCLAESVAEGF